MDRLNAREVLTELASASLEASRRRVPRHDELTLASYQNSSTLAQGIASRVRPDATITEAQWLQIVQEIGKAAFMWGTTEIKAVEEIPLVYELARTIDESAPSARH